MTLQEILNVNELSANRKENTSSLSNRINEHLGSLREQIAFYRKYPDIFVDLYKGEDSTFKFYTYQRYFLRVVMRHRYVYATFPRAYSKSFLSMMALMLRCVFYPGCHLFVSTGGK